jgi:hypothetical protein
MPTIEAELTSAKSIAVWRATLLGEVVDSDGKVTRAKHNYCAKIHHVPVADITTPLVLAVLKPIWVTKSETASRLRGRIERVLAWAVSQGMGGDLDLDHYRNPARWDGHLEHALANQAKVHEVWRVPASRAGLAMRPTPSTV